MTEERKRLFLARVPDADRCWDALCRRDEAADGLFVYALRSGEVYCRPSCSATRPRRGQVLFFPLPEAAEQAGLVPCRHCQPRDAWAADPHVDRVRRVCRFIEANLEGPLSLTDLSRQAWLSPPHLQRVFKRITGISPRQYADACRLGRLKARLREGRTVTMALYEVGYGSCRGLYERASAHLGMTPATYRRGGEGMRLRYALADGPLGRVLLAVTDRGVSAVYLGERDAELEKALRKEYPAAEVERDGGRLGAWLGELLDHLRGERPHLDLPLDVQATAFQWRVWQELRAIPYGSTRTYGEIAEALGRPRAARAVARACATNPVSVLVPCHRVVRDDGDLGGYRWGLARKRALLECEKAHARRALPSERDGAETNRAGAGTDLPTSARLSGPWPVARSPRR